MFSIYVNNGMKTDVDMQWKHPARKLNTDLYSPRIFRK